MLKYTNQTGPRLSLESTRLTRRSFIQSASVGAVGASLAGCSESFSGLKQLKVGHTANRSHPIHKAMMFMGERLSDLSGGTMGLQIYPDGQLGTERELVELLQIGSLAMTKVSAISMEGFSSTMKLFSIPYIFTDDAHYWRVLKSDMSRDLLNSLRDVRLQGLGYFTAGSRSFYMTETPVEGPRDLAGKKIRVLPSRTSIQMVEALGGAAAPVAWSELYTALQQGIVDGAENNPPSYYLARHHEVAPYFTLDEHTSVPDLIIISRRIYDSLSAQERDWLHSAMDAATDYQRELWKVAEDDALEAITESGVEIIYPDKQPFRDAVAGIKTELAETELGPLIQSVEAMEQSS